MNPPVAQLLAESLGISQEQLDAIQGGDPSPLIAAGAADPMQAILFASLLQRPSSPAPTEEARQIREQARQVVRRLKQELDAADVMIQYISQVFGACRACWGMSPTCEQCGGEGGPGSTQPVRAELLAWVQPALRRLGLRVVRAHPPGSMPTHDPQLPS